MNSHQEGPTLFGHSFTGAFTFGESQRTEWVKQRDVDAANSSSQCKRPHFQERVSQIASMKKQPTTLPQEERMKDIRVDEPNYTCAKSIQPERQSKLLEKKNQLSTLPQDPRIKELKSEVPGVGTYCVEEKVGKIKPFISFGYKETWNWARDGPSPDTYQSPDIYGQFQTATSWKSKKSVLSLRNGFGTQQKHILPKTIDLGPGQYQEGELENGPKMSFPKSERDTMKVKAVPGPGQYDHITGLSKTTGFSIAGKIVPFKTSDYYVPGPGTYQPEQYPTVKNVKVGKDRRRDLVRREDLYKPGPGNYNQELMPDRISHLNFRETGSAVNLSDRPDPNSLDKLNKYRVPSPGHYDSQTTLGGPKFSIRQKNERYTLNSNPGPGHYEPDEKEMDPFNQKPPYHYTVPQTATPSMGRSSRSNPVSSKFKNVGPGSYDVIQKKSNTRMSMSKAARFPVKQNEDVGPGQYNIPNTIGLIPKYHFERYKEHVNLQFNSVEKLQG